MGSQLTESTAKSKQWWEFEYLAVTKVLQKGTCLHLYSEADLPAVMINAIAPVSLTIAVDGINQIKLHGRSWTVGMDLPIDPDTAIALSTILEYLVQDHSVSKCQLKVSLKSSLQQLYLMFEGEMSESVAVLVVLAALRQVESLSLETVLVSARLRGQQALSWSFDMDLLAVGISKNIIPQTNSFLDDDFAIADAINSNLNTQNPISSRTYNLRDNLKDKFKNQDQQKIHKSEPSVSLFGFTVSISLGLIAVFLSDRAFVEYATSKSAISSQKPQATTKISTYQYNNQHLNQKLALLEWHMSKSGTPPQVMVVGSSRALRGIEPNTLEKSLQSNGYKGVEVFNMGINGATAKVVDLQFTQILSLPQLPKMIIWADGVRAFNNNREDSTYREIMLSPSHLFKSGETKKLPTSPQVLDLLQAYPNREQIRVALTQDYNQLTKSLSNSEELIAASVPSRSMDMDTKGFVGVDVDFEPKSYFKIHPYVPGTDDLDYRDFSLEGEQMAALERLVRFCAEHHIRLVLINMPLHSSYLDKARLQFDQKFSDRMRDLALAKKLIYLDLSQLWSQNPEYFSDPSHLNRQGAIAISEYLIKSEIPWQELR